VALSTKGINLCLKHGNTPHCAICYMAYGAIFQGGVLGRHEVGHEFGQLSLNLLEKYGNTDQRGEVNFCVGYFATSWMRPATEAEAIWRVAHQAASTARCGGYEGAADLFNVGNSSIGTIMSYHMRGAPMDEVLRESDRFLEVLRRGNLREHSGVIVSVRQFIRNLRGQTRGRTTFSDAEFDEGEFVTRLAAFGCRHYAHFYYILKAQALYLWGEYDAALEAARASAGYLADSRGMLHWAEHHFHHALVLAALHPRLGLLRRWSCLRTVRRAQRMYHDWAGRCPHNFLHKERLLAAEVFRLRGRHAEALRAYDEAVAAADKYGYLQVQALANERAARLHRELGDRPAARSYLSAACAYYRRWGARAYADCLQAALEADAQTGHSLPASPRQSRGR
jgi:tetratricopeptide (TPR) repeat protein